MRLREAITADADAMSRVLAEIIAVTGKGRPHDPDHVLATYVSHPQSLRCTVAETDEDGVLGFQSLIKAVDGSPYGVEVGWGIIGTHISPKAARQGIGSALFMQTRQAGLDAGLTTIDATIASDNAGGLAYYEAIGFRTYKTTPAKISKRYDLQP